MELKYVFKWWRLSILIIVVSIVITSILLSGKRILDIPRYIMPGIQIFLLGGLMIWLSILDKEVETQYSRPLRELREF